MPPVPAPSQGGTIGRDPLMQALMQRQQQGRGGPSTQAGTMSPEVSNTTNAGTIGGAAMGLAGGPGGALAGKAVQGAVAGLQGLAGGQFGVTDAPAAPQVGSQMFDDVVSAGQTASALNNENLSPQARFSGLNVDQTPDLSRQTAEAINNPMGALAGVAGNALGITGGMNTTSVAGSVPNQQNTPGGQAANGGGRGPNGGTATGNAMGGPGGVGRGNARGGGVGF